MEKLTLKAQLRQILGKKVKKIRKQNLIPAVLYGKKIKTIPIVLDKKAFTQIAQEAGESTLINIEIPHEKPLNALIRNIQRDPVKDEILHVDLYIVDMSQEIQTEIPLEFIGASPAVEDLEGNLITNKTSVKVECLPDKLVSNIQVDVAALKTFDDLICIKDLNIPEGIKVLDEAEDVVAQVTPPRSEEELEALEKEAKSAAETEKEHIESIEAKKEAEKVEEEVAETEKTAPEQKQKEPSKKNA